MNDDFKYLTVSDDDIQWGLYINVAGISEILPRSIYPLPKHPGSHFFNWENGRILNEFQINYITNGNGIIETRKGTYKIVPGTLLILFPGMWHRYKPETKTGWTEHYIGFNGEITNILFKNKIFSDQAPVLRIGFQNSILQEFNDIIGLAKDERPGFQHECAGKLVYLLARVISIFKNNEFANKEMERNIRKACLYLRDNLHRNLNIEEVSQRYHVSYSNFRRLFKRYTGMSANQYHLNLRIQKSKELITNSDKSIKAIANELGFESIHYFSRLFKQKEGMCPTEFKYKNSEKLDYS
ncbi:MAG: AraC family transcriptional regulator [Prolixibacteraceae bacterium]|jgi:AraC-like DNA-binding protein|nr:AraC family transcriptional regulator [Prolixibacteraceae bacterium]